MRVRLVLVLLVGGVVAVAADGLAEPPLPRAHAALDPEGFFEMRTASLRATARAKRTFGPSGCSDDMVRIAGRFCIDRFEASMIDDEGERPLSPYYPPQRSLLRSADSV